MLYKNKVASQFKSRARRKKQELKGNIFTPQHTQINRWTYWFAVIELKQSFIP